MKAELRKQLLQKRDELSKKDTEDKSHQIFLQLLPYMNKATTIGIYKNFGSEVNTEEMIAYLLKQKKKVGLPVCEKQGIMQFYEVDEQTQFQQNKMGIWEPMQTKLINPKEFDLMIVPMLGFNECQRLGYGKGYYDRYLAHCSAYKIGIAFTIQSMKFKNDSYDINMDIILYN